MKANNDELKYDPIVKIGWIVKYIGVNKSTIWRWRNSPHLNFPAPIRLGTHLCGWRKSSIENWLDSRPMEIDE